MSRHQPQPVMPFTGSPFDLDGREFWSLRVRSRLAASNAGRVRAKQSRLRLEFPRQRLWCGSGMIDSSRSVFDVEDDVLAVVPRRGRRAAIR
jgi:hypothetical protein